MRCGDHLKASRSGARQQRWSGCAPYDRRVGWFGLSGRWLQPTVRVCGTARVIRCWASRNGRDAIQCDASNGPSRFGWSDLKRAICNAHLAACNLQRALHTLHDATNNIIACTNERAQPVESVGALRLQLCLQLARVVPFGAGVIRSHLGTHTHTHWLYGWL